MSPTSPRPRVLVADELVANPQGIRETPTDEPVRPDGVSGENQVRILVVGDVRSSGPALASALEPECECVFANTAEQAFAMVSAGDPIDLVLAKVRMAGMTGYELCRKLKENAKTADIPVVFVSANGEVADARGGFEVGGADFVTLPLNLPILKARIGTHLIVKDQRERLACLKSVDETTGLANRRRFDEILENEWRRARRVGTPLTVILMGIDSGKALSESCPEADSKRCLQQVASLLSSSLKRATDFLARYDNTQFGAVLASTDARNATATAEMLRKRISAQRIELTHSNIVDRVTMSFGTASMVPRADASLKDLENAAIQMLSEAMENGRNRVKAMDFDPCDLHWYA